MKISKKILSVVLTVLLLASAVPVSGSGWLEKAFQVSAYYDETVTDGYYTYYVYEDEAVISSVDAGIKGHVVIPDTLGGYPVTTIGGEAFSNCDHITIVEIPESVTTIEYGAFEYCDNLTSAIIPESVIEIDSYTFQYCTSLISIEIPESITELESGVFYGCGNLIEVKLPETLEKIGYGAFEYCDSLTAIEIPQGVTEIGSSAFYSCGSLADVKIADTVEFIGYSAFEYCTVLEEINIPASVKTIESRAFNDCYKLINIYVDDANENYCDIEGVLYSKDMTQLVQYPIGNERTEYSIPEGTTKICNNAFEDSACLEKVTIPVSMEVLGDAVFYDSYELKTVSFLGENVTEIGSSAFADCYNLSDVTIPYGVTEIKYATFEDTAIEYMDVPASVKSIGRYAFEYCYALKEIEFKNGLESIGEYAFYGCGDLLKVEIPASVVTIEKYAFRTYGLEEIVVDENNEYFSNDESGTLFNKEKTVLVQYPIGNDRKTFIVPGTVLRIKDGAFTDCNNLREVIVPEGVTNIGASAFEDCYSLSDITIPKTVTGIGYKAFDCCYDLVDVYYGGSEDDFKTITISEENNVLLEARIHYNYDENHDYTVVKKQRPTCGEWGVYVYSCTCGYTYEKQIPPEGDHIWNEWYVYENPTCTDKGYNRRYCEVCGDSEREEIPALGGEHTWGEWITNWFSCADGGEEYRYCSTCNDTQWQYVQASGDHNFGEWELKRAADCGNMGRQERYCSDCDYVDTMYLPVVGEHKWTDWNEYDNPTCTEQGREERYCEVCYDYEYQVVPALGGDHSWSDWEFSWGSCIYGGEEQRKCTICNDYDYRNLTITGEHDWGDWEVIYEATCEEDGEEYRECKNCDEYEYKSLPTLNGEHSWSEWSVWTEATCTQWGEEYRECSVCEDTDWNGIEPTGHSFDEWKYDEVNMNMYRICHCGVAEGEEIENDSDDGVDIYYPVDPDAEFDVEEITDENNAVYKIVEEQFGSGVIKLYDINLISSSGLSVQPNGTVKVKLPHDGRAGDYKVYRVNNDGSYTDMNAAVEGDRIVFLTDHFSYYVVVDADSSADVPTNPDAHNHTYNSYVTLNPTCTQEGQKIFTCYCGHKYEETIPVTGHTYSDSDDESCDACGYDRTDNCGCNCHKGGIVKIFFNLVLFFQKLFRQNKECGCGVSHY